MDNLVRNHAILNVWSATNQDFQHNIQMVRITPDGGVLKQYPLLWDILLVPNEKLKAYYHFYQIGQVPPELLDVLKKENRWVILDDFNKLNNILVDVYSTTGQIIPRDHVFISFIYNKNLVMAVRVNRKLDFGTKVKTFLNQSTVREPYTLDNQDLIVRFYSNAWFNDPEYRLNTNKEKQPIIFQYRKITNQTDWNGLYKGYHELLKENPEYQKRIVWYRDGFMINNPTGMPADAIGSHFGWMFDDSFFYQETRRLRHLPAFISEIDLKRRKYIFLTELNDGLIHYWDDIDFYVINHVINKGVYLNRSAKHCIRQLTHNAFSIDADVVESYIKLHEWLGNIDQCSIKIMVRQGGRKNGVLNQTNRLKELYLLPREQLLNAMINSQSLVPEWKASQLEQSDYIRLVSADANQLTNEIVADAYGYHGLVENFANPLWVINEPINKLPINPVMRDIDRNTKTAYRCYWIYNKAGVLVDWFNISDTHADIELREVSKIKPTDIGYIECFNMRISKTTPFLIVDNDIKDWDLEQYGFKCFGGYTGDSHGFSSTNIPVWDDLTDMNGSLYTYTPSTKGNKPRLDWNWGLLSQANLYPMVFIPKLMFVYQTQISTNNGRFSIIPKFDFNYGNNTHSQRPMNIPMGSHDVFVNGMSLIEGIDYIKVGHEFIINTVAYHRMGHGDKTATVVIRFYGFSNEKTDGNWKPNEIGFVKGGRLSIDGVYGIHRGKSNRIILGGLIRDADEFMTGENNSGKLAPIDGQPYSIQDYIVPTENIVKDRNVHKLYVKDREVEKRVSDYLSGLIAENTPNFKHVHIQRYKLVSPVISAIITDMAIAGSSFAQLRDNFDDEDIESIFQNYKRYLAFDPCTLDLDDNYVMIEPHAYSTNIAITKSQYVFLERLNDLYLHRKVNLSHNVEIKKD